MISLGTDAVAKDLIPEELGVVDYLVEDWKKRYRVTTIEQGIRASGYPYSHEMRLRIAAHLKSVFTSDPDFSQRVSRWGLETLVLTNEEKLVANCLLLSLKGSRATTTAEIAQGVGVDEEQVNADLDALCELGFLDKQESAGGEQYTLSGSYERFLWGLGLTFHTVTLENGEEFNVQCSADALILAATDYSDQTIQIQDVCFHCMDRLRITAQNGKVVWQAPQGIRLYEGDS